MGLLAALEASVSFSRFQNANWILFSIHVDTCEFKLIMLVIFTKSKNHEFAFKFRLE